MGFGRILRGFLIPWTGLRAIFRSRTLMLWSLAPVGLALVGVLTLVFPLIWVGLSSVPSLVDAVVSVFAPFLGATASGLQGAVSQPVVPVWAEWLIGFLLVPVVLIASGLAAYAAIRVLFSPIYSFLADRALRDRQDLQLPAGSFWPGFVPSLRLIATGLAKAAIFLLFGLVFLAVSLIPGLAPLASLGIVTMIAYDALDFSYDCMLWSLSQRWDHFQRHRLEVLGFSIALTLLSLIPGLVLLLFPSVVVGASTLISDGAQSSKR